MNVSNFSTQCTSINLTNFNLQLNPNCYIYQPSTGTNGNNAGIVNNQSNLINSMQNTINLIFDSGFLMSCNYIFYTIKVLPIAFLFMRFINFWSICSFYVLIGVKMPTFLEEILLMIFNGVNGSFFDILNIHV